jgi:hypothetical protein
MSIPWTERIWREYRAGCLTRAMRDVLLTLRTYRGHGGLICPAHETLASRASCSLSTVQRALHQAQRLGLVSWGERRVRSGWRWMRASNRYSLVTPDAPVDSSLRPIWWRRRTNSQRDGVGESASKKEALKVMIREAAGLPDLLAMRRRAVEAGLLNRGMT